MNNPPYTTIDDSSSPGARAAGLVRRMNMVYTVVGGAVWCNTVCRYYSTTIAISTKHQLLTCPNRRNPGQIRPTIAHNG